MADINLNWRDDDESALSFTADLSAAGDDAQGIRRAFLQAGIKRDGRDRNRWIVGEEIEEAAQLFRQLERQGHRIEHSGDNAMILDRGERIGRREAHNMTFHGKPSP